MADSKQKLPIKFESPGEYRIEVQGMLDNRWSDRLAGMVIRSREIGPQSFVSTLTGHLRDQAQLSGVLNTLYDLHLPILSVNVIQVDNGG